MRGKNGVGLMDTPSGSGALGGARGVAGDDSPARPPSRPESPHAGALEALLGHGRAHSGRVEFDFGSHEQGLVRLQYTWVGDDPTAEYYSMVHYAPGAEQAAYLAVQTLELYDARPDFLFHAAAQAKGLGLG